MQNKRSLVINSTRIKSQKFNYIFNDNIERVWKFLKDFSRTFNIYQDLRSREIYTMGNSSFEVDSEFNFVWKNKAACYYKVFNVVDSPEKKLLHFKIFKKEKNLRIDYVFNLYDLTIEKSTLLVWDCIYEEPGVWKTPDQIEHNISGKMEIIKRFVNLLRTNVEDLKQTESILLNYSIKKVWKIVSNWKKFHKLVPCISSEIDFIGEPEAIGTIIILRWGHEGSHVLSFRLKVQEKKYDDSRKIYIFRLLCLEKSSDNPNHELLLTLTDVESTHTFIEFTHIFLKPIESRVIPELSIYKTRILKNLKLALNRIAHNSF